MNALRVLELRSQRAALANDMQSYRASAEWWRYEASEVPTEYAAAHARQTAGRLELRAKAVGDHIADVDRQIEELQGDVLIPYREPVSLTPDQCAAVDDMAFSQRVSA